jgi:hypothetical protein
VILKTEKSRNTRGAQTWAGGSFWPVFLVFFAFRPAQQNLGASPMDDRCATKKPDVLASSFFEPSGKLQLPLAA